MRCPRHGARHRRRRPLPRHSPRSARAGWPTSTAPRTAARPPCRAEAALPPLRRGRGVRRALPPRGVGAPPGLQHPNVVGGLRPRRVERHLLHRDGVPRGAHAQAGSSATTARSTRRARSTVSRSCRAARFAHRRGVVHRDIKPHNVIVDDEGRAKVTDFGIARAGASDMTETGSIMGTAQYLSPEQAQGQPVDARSDLYSIGIVLYELLTGGAVRRRQRRRDRAQAGLRGAGPAAPAQPGGPAARSRRSSCARCARTRRSASRTPTRSSRRSRTPAGDRRRTRRDRGRPSADEHRSPCSRTPRPAPTRRRVAIVALDPARAAPRLAVGALPAAAAARRSTVPERASGGSSQRRRRSSRTAASRSTSSRSQSDKVPEDRSSAQRPRRATEADEGSTVTITVSSGPARRRSRSSTACGRRGARGSCGRPASGSSSRASPPTTATNRVIETVAAGGHAARARARR